VITPSTLEPRAKPATHAPLSAEDDGLTPGNEATLAPFTALGLARAGLFQQVQRSVDLRQTLDFFALVRARLFLQPL
jgi:hypothetical protein